MDEHVVASISRLNEAKASARVVKFHSSRSHRGSFRSVKYARAQKTRTRTAQERDCRSLGGSERARYARRPNSPAKGRSRHISAFGYKHNDRSDKSSIGNSFGPSADPCTNVANRPFSANNRRCAE